VNPFGGAPNAQLGTALGPVQQQSNPFLVGQAAPGMQQQVPAVGGFGGQQVAGGGLGTFPGMGQPGGGFPGQIAPTQQQASLAASSNSLAPLPNSPDQEDNGANRLDSIQLHKGHRCSGEHNSRCSHRELFLNSGVLRGLSKCNCWPTRGDLVFGVA